MGKDFDIELDPRKVRNIIAELDETGRSNQTRRAVEKNDETPISREKRADWATKSN